MCHFLLFKIHFFPSEFINDADIFNHTLAASPLRLVVTFHIIIQYCQILALPYYRGGEGVGVFRVPWYYESGTVVFPGEDILLVPSPK